MAENKYCKRLIEVDLPIKLISEHARREKSIRHGHISTLHIWWARRPLAACRAVLCAALWPDPVDILCPTKFRQEAQRLMKEFRDRRGGKVRNLNNLLELRESLLEFIGDFANWDALNNTDFLQTAKELTKVAHQTLTGETNSKPLVFDPFAGGGSIPLEALRLGANIFASDLNPISVLINKATLEYIPQFGQQLLNEFQKYGKWINEEVKKELSDLYPRDSNGAIPVAYLWARTVKCEGPSCGAEIPLIKSLWLSKRGKDSVALKIIPNAKEKKVDFKIVNQAIEKDVGEGIVKRGSATCPCCGFTITADAVRQQLKMKHGGANDARLFCVVTIYPGQQGKSFRLANQKDKEALNKTEQIFDNSDYKRLYPNEKIKSKNQSDVGRMPLYGIVSYQDIFTKRQLVTLAALINKLNCIKIDNKELEKAVKTFLSFAIDKQVDYSSSLTRWQNIGLFVNNTYGRQALPMVWDFAEACPFAGASAAFLGAIDWISLVIEKESLKTKDSSVDISMASATKHPLANDIADVFFTDPPYYDSISYSNLSQYFYVWLKRSVGNLYPEYFTLELPNSDEECIVDSTTNKDSNYFEKMMGIALAEGRRILKPNGIAVIVFAHKSTSGWEALLQAMLDAGWIVTSSWPIDTEMGNRMNAMGTASLASSVHIVARPRESMDGVLTSDNIGDWRDVLQALPKKIHEWMPRLAQEGVIGADAIFACLGPALEIFSKYSNVEKANGEKVKLREYLEQVWSAVAKEALNMIFEGARTEGFEEDARLTAMWLWTLSTGTGGVGEKAIDDSEEVAVGNEAENTKVRLSGFSLEFDTARKIAQGLGAHLETLNTIVEIEGDRVRLLSITDRVKILFGNDSSAATNYKRKKKDGQMTLFPELEQLKDKGWSLGDNKATVGRTILDRLHQSMILFGAGRGEALRRFLVEEGVGKDDRLWRLAQALSALYPKSTDEKRWVDGVLAKKKSFGF